MGLTQTEKDHFKTRLLKHSHAIRDRLNGANPTWKRDIVAKAQKQAENRLDLAELMGKLEQARTDVAFANAKVDSIEGKLLERATGRKAPDVDTRDEPLPYHARNSTDFPNYPGGARTVLRAQCKHEEMLLTREHAIGKQLHDLQVKTDKFVDQIALCPTHIKLETLWTEITNSLELLEAAPTARKPRGVRTNRAKR